MDDEPGCLFLIGCLVLSCFAPLLWKGIGALLVILFWLCVAAAVITGFACVAFLVRRWATRPDNVRPEDVQAFVESPNGGASIQSLEFTNSSSDGRQNSARFVWDTEHRASPAEAHGYEDVADRRALREAGYVPPAAMTGWERRPSVEQVYEDETPTAPLALPCPPWRRADIDPFRRAATDPWPYGLRRPDSPPPGWRRSAS